MGGGNNRIENRLRRGRLERKTKEWGRRRGRKGRQWKRSGRGETFYLRGEYTVYVRVRKKRKRKENMPSFGRTEGDGCG